MSERKYEHLVHEFVPEYTEWGDWCPTPQAYFRGNTTMPGANYHVGFQVFTGPVLMEETHFHHGVEEYLIFLGATFPNVFDFDAEIHVLMGEDPDKMEEYIITKPTIIRVPRNMWHCPIDFKRIDKPIIFQAVYMDGTWGKVLRRTHEDGRIYYEFEGDNIRFCRYRPGELCILCGRCFTEPKDTPYGGYINEIIY